MKAVLARFASPAGFALVLLLFGVLPFASVSCEGGELGSASVSYNGLDLATGTSPEVEVTGVEGFQELADEQQRALPVESGDAPDVQWQTIVLAALLTGGILAMRLRALAAALAGVAAVLVVVIDLIARSNLISAVRTTAAEVGEGLTAAEIDGLATEGVGRELGFWVTVTGLVVLAVYNLVAAVREGPRGSAGP